MKYVILPSKKDIAKTWTTTPSKLSTLSFKNLTDLNQMTFVTLSTRSLKSLQPCTSSVYPFQTAVTKDFRTWTSKQKKNQMMTKMNFLWSKPHIYPQQPKSTLLSLIWMRPWSITLIRLRIKRELILWSMNSAKVILWWDLELKSSSRKCQNSLSLLCLRQLCRIMLIGCWIILMTRSWYLIDCIGSMLSEMGQCLSRTFPCLVEISRLRL